MFAISGVTGHTGAATANALLAAGAKIRVLVRRKAAGEVWAARGADVAIADLGDAEALTIALRGTEGAYLLSPMNYAAADPFAVATRQGESFSAAIAASGVPRAVILSSIGAQHAAGTGIIRTTHLVEQALARNATPIAFLRAAYFVENWAEVLPAVRDDGLLPSFLAPLDRAFPMVPVADIGMAAARLLCSPAWSGRRVVELAGAADATPQAVAAAFADALARPVQAIAVPRKQWVGLLTATGLSTALAQAFVQMYDGILSGRVSAETDNEQQRGALSLQATLGQLLN